MLHVYHFLLDACVWARNNNRHNASIGRRGVLIKVEKSCMALQTRRFFGDLSTPTIAYQMSYSTYLQKSSFPSRCEKVKDFSANLKTYTSVTNINISHNQSSQNCHSLCFLCLLPWCQTCPGKQEQLYMNKHKRSKELWEIDGIQKMRSKNNANLCLCQIDFQTGRRESVKSIS